MCGSTRASPALFPIYAIERNNRVSYLLGTNHLLPLSLLGNFSVHIKRIVKSLVLECNSKLTLADLYKAQVLQSSEPEVKSQAWTSSLSSQQLACFQSAAVTYFERVPGAEALAASFARSPSALNKINPNYAHWVYAQGTRPKESMERDLVSLIEKVYELEQNGAERLKHFLNSGGPAPPGSCERLKQAIAQISSKDFLEQIRAWYLHRAFPTDGSDSDLRLGIQRNLRWLDLIIKFHLTLDGPVLFAFGESHLYGAAGILELLRESGFKITQLSISLNAKLEYRKPGVELKDESILKKVKVAVQTYAQRAIERETKVSQSSSALILEYCGFSIYEQPRFLNTHVDFTDNELPVIAERKLEVEEKEAERQSRTFPLSPPSPEAPSLLPN